MIKPLKGEYPPLVLSDKVKELVAFANTQEARDERVDSALRYLAGKIFVEYNEGSHMLNRLEDILKGE